MSLSDKWFNSIKSIFKNYDGNFELKYYKGVINILVPERAIGAHSVQLLQTAVSHLVDADAAANKQNETGVSVAIMYARIALAVMATAEPDEFLTEECRVCLIDLVLSLTDISNKGTLMEGFINHTEESLINNYKAPVVFKDVQFPSPD